MSQIVTGVTTSIVLWLFKNISHVCRNSCNCKILANSCIIGQKQLCYSVTHHDMWHIIIVSLIRCISISYTQHIIIHTWVNLCAFYSFFIHISLTMCWIKGHVIALCRPLIMTISPIVVIPQHGNRMYPSP